MSEICLKYFPLFLILVQYLRELDWFSGFDHQCKNLNVYVQFLKVI